MPDLRDADLDLRPAYSRVWDLIRELERKGMDLTDMKDEVERAYEARDYTTLVDCHDWLDRRLWEVA